MPISNTCSLQILITEQMGPLFFVKRRNISVGNCIRLWWKYNWSYLILNWEQFKQQSFPQIWARHMAHISCSFHCIVHVDQSKCIQTWTAHKNKTAQLTRPALVGLGPRLYYHLTYKFVAITRVLFPHVVNSFLALLLFIISCEGTLNLLLQIQRKTSWYN